MAHELAHNIVGDHSAAHSYYMEAMIMQYFGKLAAKVQGKVEDAAAATMPGEMMPGGGGGVGGGRGRLVDVD